MGDFGFNPGDFFSGLGDLFSALLAEVLAVLEFIWNVLVAVATFLYDVTVAEATLNDARSNFSGQIFRHIFGRIWNAVLVPLVNIIRGMIDSIRRIVQKILDIIQKIRNWYFTHIFPILFAILETIATIRLVLELFRLLGAKWAAKLDRDLQKIQGYITESIVDVVGTLNRVSSILGLIVHPDMIIRRDAFGRSLWNALGQLKKAVGYGSARPVFPDEQKQIDARKALVLSPAPMYHTLADGSVEMDPTLRELDGRLTQTTRTLGIGP